MRKITTAILALALIIPLILTPLAISASSGIDIDIIDWDGDGRWKHNTWYIDLYPGEKATIELELEVSEDAIVYVEYDMPKNLFINFNPAALEIEEDDSEWIEMTVYASNDIEPDEYEIDFYFRAIPIETETETEIIYQDKYLPGDKVIEYIDRVEYIDREIPVSEYIYLRNNGGIDWLWIPVSILLSISLTLIFNKLVKMRREKD